MGIHIYILRCADVSYYVGSATGDDLQRRIDQHNATSFPGYTSTRRPVTLVWSEYFDRKTDGIAMERKLKGLESRQEGSADPFGLGPRQRVVSPPCGLGEENIVVLRGSPKRAPQDDVVPADDAADAAATVVPRG